MQDLAKLKLIYNLSRSIYTCNICCNKYAKREGKFMKKVMKGEIGQRKWYMAKDKSLSNSVTVKKPTVPHNNRRNIVLNKIYMKYITDLMATGEVAPNIVGKGIEVTRVSVTPDFNMINVFWLIKDTKENVELVEEILARVAGPLRHELSQLRVTGVVPIIKFIRDKQYSRFVEIDQRLAVADFGEDFVPTDPTLRLRTIPVLNLKLPNRVWSDIEKLEHAIDENELESLEEPLPEMRNDVLGLDQTRIMAKIKGSIDKARAVFEMRSLNIVNPLPENEEQDFRVIEYLTVKEKNKAFSAFLIKRQLDEKRRKKCRMNGNHNSEDDLHLSDQENSDDDNEFSDVDFDSEEIEEK